MYVHVHEVYTSLVSRFSVSHEKLQNVEKHMGRPGYEASVYQDLLAIA